MIKKPVKSSDMVDGTPTGPWQRRARGLDWGFLIPPPLAAASTSSSLSRRSVLSLHIWKIRVPQEAEMLLKNDCRPFRSAWPDLRFQHRPILFLSDMEAFVASPSAPSRPALRGTVDGPGLAAPKVPSTPGRSGLGAALGVASLSALACVAPRSSRPRKTKLRARGGDVMEAMPTTEINYYKLDQINTITIMASMRAALKAMRDIVLTEKVAEEQLQDLLCDGDVRYALVSLSRLPVFSHEFGSAFKDDLDLLHCLKQLKYFWNLPISQLAILMANISERVMTDITQDLRAFEERLGKSPRHLEAVKEVSKRLPAEVYAKYMENAAHLEDADPHAVYPTSIYRQCDAQTLATKDASTIEAVMSTTITTTIKIARKVLDPSNHLLYDVYKPLGRCVAVVDDKVDEHYGADIDQYFAAHNIELTKLVFSGNEVDKGIEDVERILVAMKKYSLGRHEPLLVVGGGVIADIAGFATSLYSRNTPYVMLCTSIVSGIDAGPSPRVCCKGYIRLRLQEPLRLLPPTSADDHRSRFLEDFASRMVAPWRGRDHQDGCHERPFPFRTPGAPWCPGSADEVRDRRRQRR